MSGQIDAVSSLVEAALGLDHRHCSLLIMMSHDFAPQVASALRSRLPEVMSQVKVFSALLPIIKSIRGHVETFEKVCSHFF